MSIWKEDAISFKSLMEVATAYVMYVERGGCISPYADKLVDDTIDIVMKIKANRDWVYEHTGKDIPKYDKEGNRKQKRVRSKVSKGAVQTSQATA